MNRLSFAMLVWGLLLGGCAGREDLGSLAGQTSALLNGYRQEMSSFARSQASLAQENDRRLRELRQMKDQQEGNVARARLAWELAGDKPALDLLNLLSRSGIADVERSDALLLLTPPPAPVESAKFEAGQVEALIKRLKTLEKAPTLWDRIAFTLSYDQALRDAYKKSLEEAAEESAQAAAAATAIAPPDR
jgi:hypothetical protein